MTEALVQAIEGGAINTWVLSTYYWDRYCWSICDLPVFFGKST
jgi:hypothetical protein